MLDLRFTRFFYVVTPCSSETARRFGKRSSVCRLFLLVSCLALLFDHEDGGDKFSEMLGCLRTTRRYVKKTVIFIEVHQSGFRPNVSATNQIHVFCRLCSFWRWCITLGITRFLVLVHRPKTREHKFLEYRTMDKVQKPSNSADILLSSGTGKKIWEYNGTGTVLESRQGRLGRSPVTVLSVEESPWHLF
jgi:hypothetical protein